MYTKHYGLTDLPFSIAPDPRYLFMSQQHREALAHLMYGIRDDGGFVLLTGEIGTGKTTICRCFLEQLPDTCDVAFIFNPKLSVPELLSTLCEELHIPCPENGNSNKAFIDRINAHLLEMHANGRTTLLIIDEAQNLEPEVLEQIRLLTNLETNQSKLLHVILLGQPELRQMLARPELKQLSQRILARLHLGPLQPDEIAAYIGHRLSVAGCCQDLFPSSTVKQLYRLSEGIPRKLNILCDRALLGTYVEGKHQVDRSILLKAAHEVFDSPSSSRWTRMVAGLGALVSASALATAFYYYATPPKPARPAVGAMEAPAHTQLPPLTAAVPKPDTAQPAPQAIPAKPLPQAMSSLPSSNGPGGQAQAYRTLLVQWKLDAQASNEQDLCLQAQTFGLRCLSGQGDLALLRRLDLPAVLQLKNATGPNDWVTLLALKSPAAIVASTGGKPVTVAESTLTRRWNGHYTLLWKAPPNYQAPLTRGSHGLTVAWLHDRIGSHHGPAQAPQKNPVFDEAMKQQVMHFQQTHGLPTDGVAGPLTLIQLIRSSGDASPRLTRMEG